MSESQAVGDLGATEDIADATSTDTGVPSEPAAAEPQYLELDDDLGSRYVRLKVDGEEVSVPLREALQGYNREAVSTKRFQEASRMQQEAERALVITQALERDPALAVQVLARQAGMTVEQFVGLTPAQQQQAVAGAEDEYQDPLERALAEERQARMALEQRILQREADERLQSAVSGLKQQYGINDDDVRQVVAVALQMDLGPDMFPVIYESMAFRKGQVHQQTAAEMQQQQAAEEALRRQQAAQAASLVSTGQGATNVTPGAAPPGNMSIREAFEAAWEQHVGR